MADSTIFARFAAKYGVDSNKVSAILKATAFKQPTSKNGPAKEISDEQMAALLIVADAYNLNPFTKEIYAFPDKQNGIVPVIGVDGWTRIANEHPQYDGVEFRYAEETHTPDAGKEAPRWIEAVVFRKDRHRPTVIREFLDECYKPPFQTDSGYKVSGPWQTHTKRFLRHKAFAQAVRMAFGFAGIYDEDDAIRIAEARVVEPVDMQLIDVTAPQEKAEPLAIEQRFESILIDMGIKGKRRQTVGEYLTVCAKHFNATEEEAMKTIVERPDDFKKTFPAWEKSYKQQLAAKEEKAKAETIEANNVTMVECPKEADNPDEKERYVAESECKACKYFNGCPAWETLE